MIGSVEDFCSHYKEGSAGLLMASIIGVLPILVIPLLICFWLRRQTSYPLNERSPWLVFTLLITSFLLLIAFPVNVWLYRLTNDIELCPYKSWADDAVYKLIIIFCRYANIFTYIYRSLRMWYAFTFEKPKQYVENLFNDQRFLLMACLASSFLVCLLIIPFLDNIMVLHTLYHPPFRGGFVYNNFWTISVTIEIFVLMFVLFLVRNIEREYQFKSELVILIIFNWIFSLFSLVSIPAADLVVYQSFWIQIPPQLLALQVKDWIYVIMTAVYPLHLLREKPSLPAIPLLITMKKFTMFIKEKMCFVYFAKYAEHIRQTPEAQSNPKLRFAKNYLEYYIEYMTINMNSDNDSARVGRDRLIEYLNANMEIFPPDILLPHSEHNVGIAFRYCESILQELFTEYFLKTKSSRCLLKLFRKNEIIGIRLADLKMISVQF